MDGLETGGRQLEEVALEVLLRKKHLGGGNVAKVLEFFVWIGLCLLGRVMLNGAIFAVVGEECMGTLMEDREPLPFGHTTSSEFNKGFAVALNEYSAIATDIVAYLFAPDAENAGEHLGAKRRSAPAMALGESHLGLC